MRGKKYVYTGKAIRAAVAAVLIVMVFVAMTITSTIFTNSDDGTEINRSTWCEDGVALFENRLGNNYGDDYLAGFRFGMDDFEYGDKVQYARLRMAGRGGVIESPIHLLIEGVLQKSPTTFGLFERPSQKLPKTKIKVPWKIREVWKNGSIQIPLWYTSPDIAPVINRILSVPEWGKGPAGKSLVLTIDSLGSDPLEANYVRFRDFRYGQPAKKCAAKLETFRTVYDTFVGRELLGRPTDSSVTVRINPLIKIDVFAEYGTSPGAYTHTTKILTRKGGKKPIDLVIDGLYSDAEYFYRLRFRKAGQGIFKKGEEHSFQTQRAVGSSFCFAVQADEHLQAMHKLPHNVDEQNLYKRTLQNIADGKPDFFVSLGDFAHTEFTTARNALTPQEALDRYLLQRQYIDDIGHSIPFFLVIGNHEGEQGWYRCSQSEAWDDLAYMSVMARKATIPNPRPSRFYTGNARKMPDVGLLEDYFAWHWGDALFVALEPYWATTEGEGHKGCNSLTPWRWTLGREQYEWLYETLHESDARWKFIFIHQLVSSVNGNYGRGGIEAAKHKVDHRASYEWGGEDEYGNYIFGTMRPGWMHGAIHDMLVDEGATIVFHGHDHFFAKQDLDGIVYIECPQPGDADYSFGYKGTGLYTYGDFVENSGHVEVHVDPHSVQVNYIRSYLPGDGVNGEVGYSFEISD